MKRFVSLLAHPITVIDDNDLPLFILKPGGRVARVRPRPGSEESVNAIPVSTIQNYIIGLPEPQPGVIYIVSNTVAMEVKNFRRDVMAPDTGPTALRDEKNQIIGIRGFQQWRVPGRK